MTGFRDSGALRGATSVSEPGPFTTATKEYASNAQKNCSTPPGIPNKTDLHNYYYTR